MADEGVLLGPKALRQIRDMFQTWSREIKNPGGTGKRGNISIGLSSHVAKIKTTVTARSGTTLGEGEVYLCETDSDGVITVTTIVKTAWNEGLRTIPLSTSADTYIRMDQTNYGNFMVCQPTKVDSCNYFDGVKFSDISGFTSGSVQFLTHSTGSTSGACLAWVTGSTCT